MTYQVLLRQRFQLQLHQKVYRLDSCTGIWPYNPDIFEESEFAPSQVTDRPDPAAHLTTPAAAQQATVPASCAEETLSHLNYCPADIRPLPKAGPRKIPLTGRERKQTAILTDTPAKMALEEGKRRRSGKVKRKMSLRSGQETRQINLHKPAKI